MVGLAIGHRFPQRQRLRYHGFLFRQFFNSFWVIICGLSFEGSGIRYSFKLPKFRQRLSVTQDENTCLLIEDVVCSSLLQFATLDFTFITFIYLMTYLRFGKMLFVKPAKWESAGYCEQQARAFNERSSE